MERAEGAIDLISKSELDGLEAAFRAHSARDDLAQ